MPGSLCHSDGSAIDRAARRAPTTHAVSAATTGAPRPHSASTRTQPSPPTTPPAHGVTPASGPSPLLPQLPHGIPGILPKVPPSLPTLSRYRQPCTGCGSQPPAAHILAQLAAERLGETQGVEDPHLALIQTWQSFRPGARSDRKSFRPQSRSSLRLAKTYTRSQQLSAPAISDAEVRCPSARIILTSWFRLRQPGESWCFHHD
jgi:hypothetical protein